MFRKLLSTSDDVAPLIARLMLAFVVFPHGAQHALGWFGGYGFGGTFRWMTETLGFPGPLAAVGIVTELVGPAALLVGLAGRVAGLGILALMVGAASTHLPNGFFMNWFGRLPAGSEGFEYHLLVMGLSAIVVAKGSGAYSVDARLVRGEAQTLPAARRRALVHWKRPGSSLGPA